MIASAVEIKNTGFLGSARRRCASLQFPGMARGRRRAKYSISEIPAHLTSGRANEAD